ncbi:hypothetical protein WMY93_017964 [Mugilogobius chulae]|uniref:Helicase ATP-binding domain-containing protein n=1 Tax=Mugilogobius chulae TaxID=88201 RepID=A0AAW0NMG7_9GOBI
MDQETEEEFYLDSSSLGEVDKEFDDILELNQFDGLPYSSRFYKLLEERKELPAWKVKNEFMDALAKEQFVWLSGSARTGRSSQIPQWCAEFCLSEQYTNGMVVCTQIHAQQAVDLALRVADEMDVNIGHEVGYSIPMETCYANDTVLRYCTDDVLLREMMSDPLLEHYAVVVVDQAHQRTVSTDVLLGLLKDICVQRPELRVVVLTASDPTDKQLAHFTSTAVTHIRLQNQEVGEVVHSSAQEGYFCSALRLILEIHRSEEDGDLLVFLVTTQITLAHEILRHEADSLPSRLGQLLPIAVHPGTSGSLQDVPEKNSHRRRRVFITSSPNEDFFWAVNSIRFVIDAGLERRYVYNPRIRTNSILIQPISAGQASSRRQLAGPTDPSSLMQALEELDYLAALDNHGNLSEVGIIMSELPLEPQLAKTLLASCEFDCVSEVVIIAAMVTEGDHFTLINIYKAFTQIQQDPYCSVEKWCQENYLDHNALLLVETLCSELIDTLKRIELPVSPKLGLPEWVLFHQHSFSEDNCLRTVTHIKPHQFVEMAPQYFFFNLPSSESKDVLQKILDRDMCPTEKTAVTESHQQEEHTQDRCVIQ